MTLFRPIKRGKTKAQSASGWEGHELPDGVLKFVLKDHHEVGVLWAFPDGRWHVRLYDPEKPWDKTVVLDEEGDAPEASNEAAFWAAVAVLPPWAGRPEPVFTSLEERRQQGEALRKRARAQESLPAALGGTGYYPDLLLPPGEVRGGVTGEHGRVPHDGIAQFMGNGGRWARFVYYADGEAVSGLSLRARKTRTKWTAVIDRVYTKPEHRRKGYAASLFQAARAFFDKVEHSKDLTGDGARWKSGVE